MRTTGTTLNVHPTQEATRFWEDMKAKREKEKQDAPESGETSED